MTLKHEIPIWHLKFEVANCDFKLVVTICDHLAKTKKLVEMGIEANQYCADAQHANLIVFGVSRNKSGRGEEMAAKMPIASVEQIESRIFFICGQKVMLDADLAEFYGVETKALNRAVKRNVERFPEDFVFQLTPEESADLRYQFGTSNLRSQNGTSNRGGRRYLPYVFTEHGAIMAASVLNSPSAIEVSVHVVRAFVHLREMIVGHKELAQKLNQLERKVGAHDKAIAEIINAIRQLMSPSDPRKKRTIGFAPWKEK